MWSKRNIFLVGFMGSGKTTVGRILAALTGCGFVDLDARIEENQKKTIAQIFAEHGEPYFRDIEFRVLASIDYYPAKVVALGGGTFVFPQNIEFVKRTGLSVWLDCPLEELVVRCEQYSHRPLFLQDAAKMRELYLYRLPFYQMADVHIDAGGKPPELVAREILDRMDKR